MINKDLIVIDLAHHTRHETLTRNHFITLLKQILLDDKLDTNTLETMLDTINKSTNIKTWEEVQKSIKEAIQRSRID